VIKLINFQDKVNFIWSIAELLRGPYKKEQYGDVILPMAVLRRFDCVLAETKQEVLEKYEALKKSGLQNVDPILNRISKQEFNNTSKYDFEKLLADPDNIANNLRNYINGFSKNAREIIEHFDFDKQITKLNDNNLLYLVVSEFNKIDLHPDKVSNMEMGYIFEELIRRFSEHGEAGDHYTPREVIRLMVNIHHHEDWQAYGQAMIWSWFFPTLHCAVQDSSSLRLSFLHRLPVSLLHLIGGILGI
jgi:type I restriction enzyme M protein